MISEEELQSAGQVFRGWVPKCCGWCITIHSKKTFQIYKFIFSFNSVISSFKIELNFSSVSFDIISNVSFSVNSCFSTLRAVYQRNFSPASGKAFLKAEPLARLSGWLVNTRDASIEPSFCCSDSDFTQI